jgi:hypothetical protein
MNKKKVDEKFEGRVRGITNIKGAWLREDSVRK